MGICADMPPIAATFRLRAQHDSPSGQDSLVAGLDEETDVGVHEGSGHGDVASIGEDTPFVRSLLLDTAKSAGAGLEVPPIPWGVATHKLKM